MSLEITQDFLKYEDFETEVLEVNGLVVVGFWAEWSGSCHIMDPVIEEMITLFEAKFKMVILDRDTNSHLAQKFGILTVPALLFFKDGELADQSIGLMSRKELFDKLVSML
jgi:thioredoxin 1